MFVPVPADRPRRQWRILFDYYIKRGFIKEVLLVPFSLFGDFVSHQTNIPLLFCLIPSYSIETSGIGGIYDSYGISDYFVNVNTDSATLTPR